VKWYAIIAVLIVIIAAFGVLAFYHPVSTGSSAQWFLQVKLQK
jgi:hypothetical protein